jgi:catalase
MPMPPKSSASADIRSLVVIAAIVCAGAAAFAYAAGWLSPNRLTPTKLVDSLAPPGGPALGHRRNHAKGICFTGTFESNGNAASLSRAQVFAAGRYPVLGRFNLGTPDPNAPDATVRVRGMGLQISAPDGDVWRAAMINAPVFAVSTPKAFYGLLEASGSKDPNAMQRFSSEHPEFAPFANWAGTSLWTASYAQEPYNSLNAFLFIDAAGNEHAVRWSLEPAAQVENITPEELGKRGPDYLEQEITKRVATEPQRWTMTLTIANQGDPTSDPTKPWPEGRRTVDAGTLVVDKVEAEADGPCREINFDPTILPNGIKLSDDPFPAARSAAYAKSYDLRTAEAKHYPRSVEGAPP